MRGRTLVRPARAHADVAHEPGAHDVVQRVHRLRDGRARVEAVALQHVDVLELQALQACFHGVEDVLFACTAVNV